MAVDRFPTAIATSLSRNAFRRAPNMASQLPRGFRYAIEIRNPELVGLEYKKVLENHALS